MLLALSPMSRTSILIDQKCICSYIFSPMDLHLYAYHTNSVPPPCISDFDILAMVHVGFKLIVSIARRLSRGRLTILALEN